MFRSSVFSRFYLFANEPFAYYFFLAENGSLIYLSLNEYYISVISKTQDFSIRYAEKNYQEQE
jgi:hypothetical protein